MSEALATAAESSAPDATPTRAAERLAVLRELAEIGMRLARGVVAAAEEGAAGDVALTYSRIARAVRQTLALEARLEGGDLVERRRAEDARAEAEAATARRRAAVAYAPFAERRRVVGRAVARAIEHDGQDDERMEYVQGRLLEVLDDREDDEDFLDRPIGELVAMICRDLNVAFDPDLWEDETWAIRERTQAQAKAHAATGPAPPTPERLYDPPPSNPAPAAWLSG